jgi:hypothetical protein
MGNSTSEGDLAHARPPLTKGPGSDPDAKKRHKRAWVVLGCIKRTTTHLGRWFQRAEQRPPSALASPRLPG